MLYTATFYESVMVIIEQNDRKKTRNENIFMEIIERFSALMNYWVNLVI